MGRGKTGEVWKDATHLSHWDQSDKPAIMVEDCPWEGVHTYLGNRRIIVSGTERGACEWSGHLGDRHTEWSWVTTYATLKQNLTDITNEIIENTYTQRHAFLKKKNTHHLMTSNLCMLFIVNRL